MARPKTVKPVEIYPHWPSLEGCAVPTRLVPVDQEEERPYTETLRIVVARLQDYIEDKGWSLREVADAVGVNHVSIHDMLRGRTWPRAEHIAQIELALDVALWPKPAEVRAELRRCRGADGTETSGNEVRTDTQ